jgi:hypothetical protein
MDIGKRVMIVAFAMYLPLPAYTILRALGAIGGLLVSKVFHVRHIVR